MIFSTLNYFVKFLFVCRVEIFFREISCLLIQIANKSEIDCILQIIPSAVETWSKRDSNSMKINAIFNYLDKNENELQEKRKDRFRKVKNINLRKKNIVL